MGIISRPTEYAVTAVNQIYYYIFPYSTFFIYFCDVKTTIDQFEPLTATPGSRLIIAGPCSAESEEQTLTTARALASSGIKVFRAGLWKPRTMPGNFDGVGAQGLPWLVRVKAETGMLTATEVATAEHVALTAAAGIDILWIGARTVANPFAVQEIADAISVLDTKPAVLIKNPVSPDLGLWIGALQRIYSAGVRRLVAVHRGFTAYDSASPYRNEPLWRIPFELRRRLPSLPMICDPSHIAGRRDLVGEVAARAVGMGFCGLIIESHCDPENALSDSAQQLTPADLKAMLLSLPAAGDNDSTSRPVLEEMRRDLDMIDDEIITLLGRRMDISARIGRFKKEQGITAVQPRRYTAMVDDRIAAGNARGLGEPFMRTVWAAIHEESVARQLREMKADR